MLILRHMEGCFGFLLLDSFAEMTDTEREAVFLPAINRSLRLIGASCRQGIAEEP